MCTDDYVDVIGHSLSLRHCDGELVPVASHSTRYILLYKVTQSLKIAYFVAGRDLMGWIKKADCVPLSPQLPGD